MSPDYGGQSIHTGGSFVDLDIEVVVQQSAGTLLAFKPEHFHGTSLTLGSVNYIMSLTSTKRVNDGYRGLGTDIVHFLPCRHAGEMNGIEEGISLA